MEREREAVVTETCIAENRCVKRHDVFLLVFFFRMDGWMGGWNEMRDMDDVE